MKIILTAAALTLSVAAGAWAQTVGPIESSLDVDCGEGKIYDDEAGGCIPIKRL